MTILVKDINLSADAMSIHCVTLLFICHHLFPCTHPLSVPAQAHPLAAERAQPWACLMGKGRAALLPLVGQESGEWDTQWHFWIPHFAPCLHKGDEAVQRQRRGTRGSGRGRYNAWARRQNTHLRLELRLPAGTAKGGGQEWPCGWIGSEESVRTSRLRILVWFVSFSSLYYWNSELHFMLVIRWVLLIFPPREAHKCVWVCKHSGAYVVWVCPCVSVRDQGLAQV